jgi:hypothetical protein
MSTRTYAIDKGGDTVLLLRKMEAWGVARPNNYAANNCQAEIHPNSNIAMPSHPGLPPKTGSAHSSTPDLRQVCSRCIPQYAKEFSVSNCNPDRHLMPPARDPNIAVETAESSKSVDVILSSAKLLEWQGLERNSMAAVPPSFPSTDEYLGHADNDYPVQEMRFLVSSCLLANASAVFRRLLDNKQQGDMHVPPLQNVRSNDHHSHHQEEPSGYQQHLNLTVGDSDMECFFILLSIIHGRNSDVPSEVSLATLGKFALLVHYYHCHQITKRFVDVWISKLENTVPKSYGRDCVQWLLISWVFSRCDIFETMVALR